ncbi:MAG: PucR family transcriptional regulator ligand-binding domain-containing protein [Bacillota bacterium]|nr:PucR family transcriptional regulator ligand-binding domain-containing protein [Bacillota bacterium]
MGITVQEALALDILNGFKVVAGRKGLSREINHVAVWDYETAELIEKNFSSEDFALSTLVAIRDDVGKLYEVVERMIAVGISCLAIKNVYFDHIPQEVLSLADKNQFPIMIFTGTFTEDVIVYVTKAINDKKRYDNLASIIDNIIYGDLNEAGIRKLALGINMNFKEKSIVAFCKKIERKTVDIRSFSEKEMEEAFSRVILYKNGYLVINTFEKDQQKDIEKTFLRRLEWWGFDHKEYVIGIGSLYDNLGNLNKSIQESLYAFKYAEAYKKDISLFHELGINKMLLPILDNPWVIKYYNEMIEPLIAYDKNNETELLDTAVKYIENNGDIKATAEDLFQHGNTVRYRIDKISKVLYGNGKCEHFYEELAAAVRIYILKKGPL